MTTTTDLSNSSVMKRLKHARLGSDRRAFTLAELMLAITIGGIVLAGAATTVNLWARSSVAVGNYADMSGTCRRALDIFASDVRMANDVSVSTANTFTFTAFDSGTSSVTVSYVFDDANDTVTRTYDGTSRVILDNVEKFGLTYSDLTLSATTNPLSLKVVQIKAILQKKVINLSNTDEIISARFMLRNRRVST